MYVCLCNGVTDHDIRRAVAAGCRTLGDLTMQTGCGANCGCCLEMAADLLAEVPVFGPDAAPAFKQTKDGLPAIKCVSI